MCESLCVCECVRACVSGSCGRAWVRRAPRLRRHPAAGFVCRGSLCACEPVFSRQGAPLGEGGRGGARRPAPPSQTCRLFSLGASALITHFIFCTCPDASRLHSSRLNVPVGSAASKGTSGFQAEQSVSGNHDCPWTQAAKQLNLGLVTVTRGVGEAGVVVKPDPITREAPGGPPSFPKPRQPRPSPCPSQTPRFVAADRLGGALQK